MKQPQVTLGWAQSLDGRLATQTGDSQWIGGHESLQLAHELRRDHQAILVGVGTVLKDNPRLTCRIPQGRNPLRIVLDTNLKTPSSCTLVSSLDEAPTWIYTSFEASAARKNHFRELGVAIIEVAQEASGHLSLPAILADLAEKQVASVYVEGGAAVLTSFLSQRLAHRAVVVTAPFFIGKGREAVGDLGSTVLSEVPRPLRWKRWDLGDDLATELIFR